MVGYRGISQYGSKMFLLTTFKSFWVNVFLLLYRDTKRFNHLHSNGVVSQSNLSIIKLLKTKSVQSFSFLSDRKLNGRQLSITNRLLLRFGIASFGYRFLKKQHENYKIRRTIRTLNS